MPAYTLEEQRELDALIEHETVQRLARRIVSASTVDQEAGKAALAAQDASTVANTAATIATDAARAAGSVHDDDIAPEVPTGVEVTPTRRGLEVSWTDPAASDAVSHVVVSITRTFSGVSRNYRTQDNPFSKTGLEVAPYDVQVTFKDRFGLSSPASVRIQATPLPSISDEISAATKVRAGEFSNLLNDPGLSSLTDASKLAEGVVRRVAMNTGEGANLLPWHEAEYENYAHNTTFPVPGYSSAINSGHTLTVTSIGSGAGAKNWLSHNKGAVSSANSTPYADWSNYDLLGSGWYSLSAYVRRAVGASDVRIVMYKASDASGTGQEPASLMPVYSIPEGEETRIFTAFQRDTAKPFMRWTLQNLSQNTTVRWSRFQLEKIGGPGGEPSPYKIPAMGVGALAARILAAWDLTAVRAMIGEATIESAKIKELSAGKLTAGEVSIDGSIDLVGRTQLTAGGGRTVLSSSGLQLTPLSSAVGRPSDDSNYKLSPVGSRDSGLWFYETASVRGMHLRSDGDGGGTDTRISLVTTRNGDATQSAACRILLDSFGASPGTVYIGTDLDVDRDLAVANSATVLGWLNARDGIGVTGGITFTGTSGINPNRDLPPTDMGPGTLLSYTHNLAGAVPRYVFPQWLSGVRWEDITHGVDNWRVSHTNQTVNIWNDAGATRRVRLNIIR